MTFGNAIKGGVTFIITLALSISGWYMVTPLMSLIGDDFFKAMLWIGIVFLTIVANVGVPWWIINSKGRTNASIGTVVAAGIELIFAYLGAILAINILPPIFTATSEITSLGGGYDFGPLQGLFWFGVIILMFLAIVVFPPFIALGGLKEIEEVIEEARG